MDIVKLNDNLTEINKIVRVEIGPLRKKATATKELLDNLVTASHYKEGAIDALGKTIVLDKVINYIDWKSNERCWYLYQKEEEIVVDKDNKNVTIERFNRKGDYTTYEEALGEAIKLVEAAK